MRYLGKHFSTYPWHSINIIPNGGLVMTYDDGEIPVRYGSLLEIVIFGQVFHINFPLKVSRGRSIPLIGPLWSKKKKKWYRASK
jgi:hypothetical protein